MSKFRPRPAHFEHKSQIAPNSLVFHPKMTDATKLLLLALNGIVSCAPNWVVVQSDLQNRLNWGRAKMQSAIREGVYYGYIKVTQARQTESKKDKDGKYIKGRFLQNEFEFDIDGGYEKGIDFKPSTVTYSEQDSQDDNTFLSGDMGSKVGLSSTALSPTDNQPLPMPMSLPIPKTNVLIGNAPLPPKGFLQGFGSALPSSTEEIGNGRAMIIPSATRKFKRNEHHQARFEWLMTKYITDDKNRIYEDEISYLSHAYSMQQLEDAYSHLQFKLTEQHFKAKSLIAVYKHILKNEHCPINSNCLENIKTAKSFAQEMNWNSLIIKQKHVMDKTFSGKDISLNMDPMAFFEQLVGLYQCLRGE